jgi:NAD(P)H-flavin reductase
MYKIIRKNMLTPTICLMDVEVPRIAAAALPGQFLIVRARPEGERVPLTICDYDRSKGTVTIVTQVVGASSRMICALEEGACFTDVVGPLGRPSDFVELSDAALKGRRFLFVAGGLGTAPVYPQAKYLHERGAVVDVIVGAKTADLLILRQEMASVCDNLYICTDDGSEGHHGLVTEKIKLFSKKESSTTRRWPSVR